MSAEKIRQFVHFLDRQQAEFLAAVEEGRTDDALHHNWMKGLVENGHASEKPTRMQGRLPADEREAERRHAEAKVAVAAVPPHLAEEWLCRLARMLQAHKRLLSHCVAAAARETQFDHNLVQACRELRDEALRELNALPVGSPAMWAVPPEQADAADAAAGQPIQQHMGWPAPAGRDAVTPMTRCDKPDHRPTPPPSLREQIDAADRRLDAAESCLAEANAALRRFDRHKVFRRLQTMPPGEKNAPVESAGKEGAGEGGNKGRFYTATAFDFRMCIDLRLRRATSVFMASDFTRHAEQCAADLRRAARRLSRVVRRDVLRILDACRWSDPFWPDAKSLLAAAILREPVGRFVELLTRANTGRTARERMPQLWHNWFQWRMARRRGALTRVRQRAEDKCHEAERHRDRLVNGEPKSEAPVPTDPAEAARAACQSCRQVITALACGGVTDFQDRIDRLRERC